MHLGVSHTCTVLRCRFCVFFWRLCCSDHRHRIDKYLDTLLANQPISNGEVNDHCQKGGPQDGGLPELIVARSCLTNHSEAATLWLVTPKQDVVGNHQWRHWRVVCCYVEDVNFGMQNLRPSSVKVKNFPAAILRISYSGGFRFHCRYCLCGSDCCVACPVLSAWVAVSSGSVLVNIWLVYVPPFDVFTPATDGRYYASRLHGLWTLAMQHLGRRAFSVAGPMTWNSLPDFYPGSNEQHRLF